MKYEMKRTCGRILAVVALVAGMATLAGCNPEPDESDLYTATGETAADYIKRKSELTSFDYILTRVRLDRNLSSYGEYTVFAPTNEAIAAYIDSLYNDTECPVPHNSMTENSLEGLSDSIRGERPPADDDFLSATNGNDATVQFFSIHLVQVVAGLCCSSQASHHQQAS